MVLECLRKALAIDKSQCHKQGHPIVRIPEISESQYRKPEPNTRRPRKPLLRSRVSAPCGSLVAPQKFGAPSVSAFFSIAGSAQLKDGLQSRCFERGETTKPARPYSQRWRRGERIFESSPIRRFIKGPEVLFRSFILSVHARSKKLWKNIQTVARPTLPVIRWCPFAMS